MGDKLQPGALLALVMKPGFMPAATDDGQLYAQGLIGLAAPWLQRHVEPMILLGRELIQSRVSYKLMLLSASLGPCWCWNLVLSDDDIFSCRLIVVRAHPGGATNG